MFPGMLGHPAHLPAQPGTPAPLWQVALGIFIIFSGLQLHKPPWGARSRPGAACSGCVATSHLCTGGTGQPRSASSRAINHPEILCSEIISAIAMPSFSSWGGGGPFGSDTVLICQCRGLLLQQLPIPWQIR